MTARTLLLALPLLVGCFGKDGGSDEDEDDGDGGSDDGGVDGPDEDGDGYAAFPDGDDCDDADPDVHPLADEYCDGVDNDCDGTIDEDGSVDATRWYADDDGDGFGDPDDADTACYAPDDGDWVTAGGDCDDTEDRIHPDATEKCNGVDDDCDEDIDEDDAEDAETWFLDEDEDGYGGAESRVSCDDPALGDEQWVLEDGDCDDDDDAVYPDATEVCDGTDNDCDGLVDDEDDDVDETSWTLYYLDDDGDGYGDPGAPELSCSAPADHVLDDTDCDDTDEDVNPGETEVCDDADTDEDCSGDADDDDPDVASAGLSTWIRDADRDGYGSDSATPVFACDDPSTSGTRYVRDDDSDCDDGDADVNPGEDEVCDPDDVDEDCSGDADDDDSGVDRATMSDWYLDGDGDGYGSTAGLVTQCDDPSGGGDDYVANDDDCDDDRSDVNPGQSEVCDDDDTDEDCSGDADDEDDDTLSASMTDWHRDVDEDGYGDEGYSFRQCEPPTTGGYDWVTDDTDCDDTDGTVNPGAEEICDDIDNDCDPDTTTDGEVTFIAADGTTTDLTDDFSGRTELTLDEDGELRFCGGRFAPRAVVTADVTVQGYDDTTLTGLESFTPFRVEGGSLTLRNLTLTEGYGEYDGRYRSSGVYYTGGGLVWAEDGELTIENVDMVSSYAESAGCIWAHDTDIRITDSFIHECEAIAGGGAMYLYFYNDLYLEDVVIYDNQAGSLQQGGGIWAQQSDIDMVDSTIRDNWAFYGTGLYNEGGLVTCSGDRDTTAGILRNIGSASSYAVYLGGSSGETVFVADSCDFGEGSWDNDGFYDIQVVYLDYFSYGDDESFTCTAWEGCE